MTNPLGPGCKGPNSLRFEIKRIQRESGITTIYVTHDQEEALSISDRVALMNDGRIGQTGSPRDIYLRPANSFVADFVGVNNLLEGEYLGEGQFRWKEKFSPWKRHFCRRDPAAL